MTIKILSKYFSYKNIVNQPHCLCNYMDINII